MSFLRKRYLWIPAKLLAMAFPTLLLVVQIPEMQYDLSGGGRPVEIATPEQLAGGRSSRATFAAVSGKIDFDKKLSHTTYGLAFTYFTLEGYGESIIVRTYNKVDDNWSGRDRFEGKLRPYNDMPFSRTVRAMFRERCGLAIPPGAFFLAHEDVPDLSGWNVGAVIFSTVLWATMFYFFFLRRRKGSGKVNAPASIHPS